MSSSIRVTAARFAVQQIPMRMPFRFGAVTLTSAAQLHLYLDMSVNGTTVTGLAADMLAPKWYDKDPDKTYADNLNDLVAGARLAADTVLAVEQDRSLYRLWRDTYDACQKAGPAAGRNPLVAGNGPSLIERALFDGLGLALDRTYHQLLIDNVAGIELADMHDELAGLTPADVIPAGPGQQIYQRHTVGMVDPLRTDDIGDADRLSDGLPQSLEQYIAAQGLRYFKLKVGGDVEQDAARLAQVAEVLPEGDLFVSLDGNEQYNDPAALADLLDRLQGGAKATRRLYDAIGYLEQPLDRRIALDPASTDAVRTLSERKPMVIDESDEELSTFRESAALGYRGVSSKACKGLIKALANQALCHRWNQQAGTDKYMLTGEDLTNVPVVALHQDLTHLAALGVRHVERNGHHYVRGLHFLPDSTRAQALERHPELYAEGVDGLVSLTIRDGRIQLASLQRCSGLGVGVDVSESDLQPLDGWRPQNLEGDSP